MPASFDSLFTVYVIFTPPTYYAKPLRSVKVNKILTQENDKKIEFSHHKKCTAQC